MALPAGLQATEILDAAMIAFRRRILPIRLFSTAWRKANKPLMKGEKMLVPYYPLETAASKDFDPEDGYDFTDAGPNVQTKEVILNKRKYQPLITTSAELERYNFNLETLGTQKGEKLAADVVADILSVVTLANFGAAVFTGAASTFDADDVAAIQQVCDEAEWPEVFRSLILKPAYNTALVTDNAIQAEYAYGSTDPIREGRIPRLNGFGVVPANGIPANAQNLVGMAVYPSAIAVGFSPITPAESVRKLLTHYEVLEDPDTGIILEYRAWGDPDSDSHKEVIECNYGYAVGETAALKRIVSA